MLPEELRRRGGLTLRTESSFPVGSEVSHVYDMARDDVFVASCEACRQLEHGWDRRWKTASKKRRIVIPGVVDSESESECKDAILRGNRKSLFLAEVYDRLVRCRDQETARVLTRASESWREIAKDLHVSV